MSVSLDFSLTVLIWILIAFFAIFGYFLSKCLIELSDLMKNCKEICKVYNDEMPGIVKDIKETLSNLNKLSAHATQSANGIKSILYGTVGAGSLLLSLFRKSSGGFLNGLVSGFKMFKK